MALVGFQPIRGTQEEIDGMPISDGQILFNTDTTGKDKGKIYLDVGNERHNMGGDLARDITQKEFDSLTEEEQKIGTYYITDAKGYTIGELKEDVDNLSNDISEEFSVEKTYSSGDYVIYNNELYKFTNAKSAGEWNSSLVSKTTVGNELAQQNSKIESISNEKLLCKISSSSTSVSIPSNDYKRYSIRLCYTNQIINEITVLKGNFAGTTRIREISGFIDATSNIAIVTLNNSTSTQLKGGFVGFTTNITVELYGIN